MIAGQMMLVGFRFEGSPARNAHVRPLAMRLKQFLKDESGVATVDWVVIAAGATAMGVMALGITQTEMGEYSWSLRDNLQATSYDSTWTEYLTLSGDRIDIRDLETEIVAPPP